jgi:putative hydrolase of the HAD superfamily
MEALGIESRFDAIFNSAELGVAKPDRRAFEMVCSRLGVEPAEVLFTDDSERKLEGAIEIGMTARHFTGVHPFADHLREVGLRA